jgi:hypothetical protein
MFAVPTRRSAQMAWAKAEVAAGCRGCTLTTVPWDATTPVNKVENIRNLSDVLHRTRPL